jgi:sulfur-oxidizing protein SoxY
MHVNTMKRRTFLKGAMASGVVAVAAGAGLLRPTEVLAAAAYPSAAFKTKGVEDTLKSLYGSTAHSASSKITLDAPIQAENAAVVPVTVETSMNAQSIAIMIPNNPATLAASVDLASNATGYFRTRVKMGKTSDIVAVVRVGGTTYSTKKLVKVTVGGCGG